MLFLSFCSILLSFSQFFRSKSVIISKVFISLSHAIRRIRERYINPDKEAPFADMKTQNVVDLAIFKPHDCGIFFKAGKMHGDVLKPFFDKDGNIPGVIFM